MHKKLLRPFSLHSLELSNRVALAPMTRSRSGEDRVPKEIMADYYVQRASAGLIISEASSVSPIGEGFVNTPGIYTDEMVDGWKKITAAVHEAGGKMFLQLWHTGRASHSSFLNGDTPVSASDVRILGEEAHTPEGKQPFETPRPLTIEEIKATVNDYKQAAENAKEAGFDGVEVHAANGYLINQFIESKTNKREDAYGGSIENRSRLLFEIVDAVCGVYSSNRVGVRVSPNGSFNDMGSEDYVDQHTYIGKQLSDRKLAYLHVIDGLSFGFHELGDAMTLADYRSFYDGMLMGNCGYDYESANEAIENGHADMIAIGRPFISNPDLIHRYENGLPLNPDAPQDVWYAPIGAEGYTDFPKAKE